MHNKYGISICIIQKLWPRLKLCTNKHKDRANKSNVHPISSSGALKSLLHIMMMMGKLLLKKSLNGEKKKKKKRQKLQIQNVGRMKSNYWVGMASTTQ